MKNRFSLINQVVVGIILSILFTNFSCCKKDNFLPKPAGEVKGRSQIVSTPLIDARGDLEKVKSLIASGADVNQPNELGITALHYASFPGKMKLAKLLIESGADVNAKDGSGATPLHLAASNSNEGGVELLLQAGADKEAQDYFGDTPLHQAAYFGRKNIVKSLIASGADVNAKDNKGRTPLDIAKEENKNGSHDQIIALLSR